eukprot:COSAG05_NODE_760_length_7489_cov_1.989716_6_plen_101_part_00
MTAVAAAVSFRGVSGHLTLDIGHWTLGHPAGPSGHPPVEIMHLALQYGIGKKSEAARGGRARARTRARALASAPSTAVHRGSLGRCMVPTDCIHYYISYE